MKNLKLLFFYSIFYMPQLMGILEGAGSKGGVALATAITTAAPIVATDAGINFGLNTVKYVCETTVAAVSVVGETASAAAATVKSAAIAVAAAPATPYIVGGVVVTYGGYKVYRYYNPTPEEIAKAAKCKAETEQSRAMAAQEKAKKIASKLEYVFKKKLLENLATPRDKSGLPIACQEAASRLAVAAGRERVDAILKDFIKYSLPLPSKL